MKVEFNGREWDTKKTYHAAGHTVHGVWHPYEDAGDLAQGHPYSSRPCRIVRIFINMETGDVESLLLRTVTEDYHVIRVDWVPDGFIDTTERKVAANVKKMRPKDTGKGR